MSSEQLLFHIVELLIIIAVAFKVFFTSYVSEKGKNLATKEDIAEITDKVEKVRLQYAVKGSVSQRVTP